MTYGIATTNHAEFIECLFPSKYDEHYKLYRWQAQLVEADRALEAVKQEAAMIIAEMQMRKAIDQFRAVGGKMVWET